MDATLHAPPPARRRSGPLVPSARTVAALTAGIGIGLVAALPVGGGGTPYAILAVVAATAAAAVVVFRSSSPAAIVVADVLLGIAVIATVFGRIGLLYVPLMLAFLAATARIERAPGSEAAADGLAWEPAPEFEAAMPASVAAPVESERFPAAFEPAPLPAEPVSEAVIVDLDGEAVIDLTEPSHGHQSHPGRHRAPSPVRRAAAAAARAGRRLGTQARTGVGNLRTAIVTEPADVDPPDPTDEPLGLDHRRDDPSEIAAPDLELDSLRHRFEERELELVASGKGWSGLHRAYGELRYLPPPATPPRPPRRPVVEINDAEWETPVWKTIGDP